MTAEQELLRKAEGRSAVFGVVGLGYVGLPLAVEIADAGFPVIGFDISQRVVDSICAGTSHIKDVPSERLGPLVHQGRIGATTDMARLREVDAISICVPTPLSKTKDPDISYILAVAESIRKTVRRGQAVILESTTYPGTTRELLLPRIESQGLTVGRDVFLAFSPERVDPSNPTWHTRNTPKVVGGLTEACRRVVLALYGPVFDRLVPVSSPEAAELVKLLENTFRSVNIALANELAFACRKIGVDPWEVIDAAATKPFGFMPFYPGPGIGGHCIPVDPLYLSWKIRLTGYEAQFIALADQINRAMPEHVVTLVGEALNDRARAVRGASVLILGVTYKPDVNDIRESPALEIMEMLARKGARISYADPFTPQLTLDGHKLSAVESSREALAAADCVLILTNHSAFDYAAIAEHSALVVDTRNALKAHRRGRPSIVTL